MNESRIPFKISDNIFYIISQFNAYSKISKKQSKKRIEIQKKTTYAKDR